MRVCALVAVVVLLLSGLLPVLFFHFPGPRFMPFSYEGMWAFTHIIWKPFRVSTGGVAYLRDHLNPYIFAPLFNAVIAFCLAYWFLYVVRRKKSHDG